MELLAPAGNFDKLATAVHFGADAVYFAGKMYGLRAFAGNFEDDEIVSAMKYLHEKGKKGYVTLNIVAKNSDFEHIDKFLRLLVEAKVDGVIVTNDWNLNKVIQFQNVQVLNINNLAKSLRPRVIPGEHLHVTVVKKGTERQQGVAYMDDGTMVVVEDGRYYMNENIEVEVTSALQTDAGRMIFARPLHSGKPIGEDDKQSKDDQD